MIFPTIEFACFFVVVLVGSWLLMPNPRWWRPFILLASLAFYAYADWRFVGLLLLSVVLNQAAATLIASSADPVYRRRVLWCAVVADIAVLAVFKYVDFFATSIDAMLERLGIGMPLPLLHLALPIAISFFTFQAISYVVDVYRGDVPLARPIDTAIYLTFFPHLVAGPIVRAREFIPQLTSGPRDPRRVPAAPALMLIAGGLVKKVVIADVLATRLVDPVFGSPSSYNPVEVWLAVLGYAAQIYCDFSAYTDMAIGFAMLLGFRFPQNFDRPYRARSLRDFWHRWHMTLSRWLRDYVYVPLGGSRRGVRRTYLNLMLTFLIGGLWHGAAWTFVIWGAIHGGGLVVQRWWAGRRREPVGATVARAGTAHDDDGGSVEEVGPLGYGVAPVSAASTGADRATVVIRPDPVAPGFDGSGPVAVGVLAPRRLVLRRRPSATGRPAPGSTTPGAATGRSAATGRPTAGPDATGPGTTGPSSTGPAATGPGTSGPAGGLPPGLAWALTFAVVCLAWVFFRAPDLTVALEVLGRLVTGWSVPLTIVTPTVVLLVAAGLGTQWVPDRFWYGVQERFAALSVVFQGVLLGLLIVACNVVIGQAGVAPFLYFRF
ncbi:MAG: MBOAT family protein [Actinomycetota bacterium]|nr:MAG: MBOAT family protein [Actinomycetota bacterium]